MSDLPQTENQKFVDRQNTTVRRIMKHVSARDVDEVLRLLDTFARIIREQENARVVHEMNATKPKP